MKNQRPTEAKTRRGNRVYRNRFKHEGEAKFAEDYTFAIKKDGERHRLNLGPNLEVAKKVADQIEAFLSVPSNTFLDLFGHPDFQELKKPQKYRRLVRGGGEQGSGATPRFAPTVGDILRIYEENAVHLSRTTVIDNCNALRHLTAGVLGLRKLDNTATNASRATWRKKVGAVPIGDLTPAALEGYRTRIIAQAGSDGIVRGKTITTLNTYFRCARSVFSERMMVFYEGFVLPNPLPFHKIRSMREPSRRYISQVDVPAIVRAARERFWDPDGGEDREEETPGGKGKSTEDLVAEDRSRFIILLLTISCGLRPKEISRLTWEQVDFDRNQIHVAVTSYDTPKARSSEASVDVSPAVLDYLREFRKFSRLPPFVIPAVTRGDREPHKRGVSIFKVLCKWLRDNGVDRENPLYVFRKEAGSMIFQQTDSYDLAADFLRNDPRIAREHYVGRKKRLLIEVPGLSSAEISPN